MEVRDDGTVLVTGEQQVDIRDFGLPTPDALRTAGGAEALERAVAADAVGGARAALVRHDGTAVPVSVEAVAVEGYPFEEEYVIIRRDGEERRVYSRADPVLDGDREVVALTGIIQDASPEEESSVFAQRIRRNCEQAFELLNALLAEARRPASRSTTTDVDLGAVVDRVIDTLDEQITRTGSAITADELPRVEGHEPLLRQGLLNLVGNALKSGGTGGSTVRISAVETDGVVEIRVDDDGPGVPEEERDAIFEGGSDLGGARFALRLRRASEEATDEPHAPEERVVG